MMRQPPRRPAAADPRLAALDPRSALSEVRVAQLAAAARRAAAGGNANAPMAPRELGRYGRKGDTIVAHINPREAALLKARGGAGTINPRTGLLEFFDEGGGDEGDTQGGGTGQGGSDTVGTDRADKQQSAGDSRGFGSAAERDRDRAAIDALGENGDHVNAASSVMDGRTPSFGDKVADFFGSGAPGGFFDSDAALEAAGLLGSVVAGPFGGIASRAIAAGLQGRSPAGIANALAGFDVAGLANSLGGNAQSGPAGPGPGRGGEAGDVTSADQKRLPAAVPLSTVSPQALQTLSGGGATNPTGTLLGRLGNPPGSLAALLAQYGVGQDNLLAHLTPDQAALLHAYGGSGTVNPATGMQQFDDTGAAQTGNGQTPSITQASPNQSGSSYSGPIDAASFNAAGYLAANPDVAKAAAASGQNPDAFALTHFQTWGQKEGRNPSGTSLPDNWNSAAYLKANPDVNAWAQTQGNLDTAAQQHYLTWGGQEHRHGGTPDAPLSPPPPPTNTGPSNQDLLDRLNQLLAADGPTNADGTWRSATPEGWSPGKNSAAGWNSGNGNSTATGTSPPPPPTGSSPLSNVFASQVAMSPDRDPRFRDRRNEATPAYNFIG